MPGQSLHIVPVLIICFIAWRVVRRVRRNIGRQPITPKRMIVRITIYALLTLFITLGIPRATDPMLAGIGLLLGLIAGAGLGLYGVHLTKFDSTPQGRFYTPNPYLGVGLSFLLVGRLLYRILVVTGAAQKQTPVTSYQTSPLTIFIFGLLAGYYIAYFSGVLARRPAKVITPPLIR